ncbi:MAG: lysophospholipid acyltransferase family protein [Bacteroidota bacterium]
MRKKLLLIALRTILWRVVLLWCKSLRITFVNGEKLGQLRTEKKKYVAAFWHGSMFVGWFLHRPVRGGRTSALVSQSKDGEFLSTILERWSFSMIRGSSHIGGKEAMQLMVDAVKSGSALAITPDGPRGPIREMKMGAVRTAQRANVPLVLAGIAMKKKKLLRSWDKFEVPMPFSKVAVHYSEPIMVPAELTGEPLDRFKKEMEQLLNQLTLDAERTLTGGNA